MKIVAADASSLKFSIDAIASLVEEGIFEITNTGIHLKAIDPSQISMISFIMPKESFLEYEINEERKIGLDIEQLSNVLSRGTKTERAELEIEDGRFVIKFVGEKKKRTFKIQILDIGEGIQKEPRLESGNFVKINASTLKEILKDAKLISSHIRFLLSANYFIAEVNGDSGDVHAEFEKNSAEIIEIKTTNDIRATFPLQYLEDIIKASPNNEIITMYLETDKPLKVEYNILGTEVKYYLAPRIESE
ncbi:MAG: proliferating cell nuclear antigen (pcna) [Candidatus Micrarchaeota archaeon]